MNEAKQNVNPEMKDDKTAQSQQSSPLGQDEDNLVRLAQELAHIRNDSRSAFKIIAQRLASLENKQNEEIQKEPQPALVASSSPSPSPSQNQSEAVKKDTTKPILSTSKPSLDSKPSVSSTYENFLEKRLSLLKKWLKSNRKPITI